MLGLMSDETSARLLSFSAGKKTLFMLLVYERMIPELHSFCLAERRNYSIFQKAQDAFWQWLTGVDQSTSWERLSEDILNETPDTEDFGTLAGSLALNAALVAAAIASFIADGQDSHVVETIHLARDSIDAYAIGEKGSPLVDSTITDYGKVHPLAQKERRAEEEDISALGAMRDAPWPESILSVVRHGAQTKSGLLDYA